MHFQNLAYIKLFTILSRILTQYCLYRQIQRQTYNFITLCGESFTPIKHQFLFIKILILILTPYLCRFYRKIQKHNKNFVYIICKWLSTIWLRVSILFILDMSVNKLNNLTSIFFALQLFGTKCCILILSFVIDFWNFEGKQIAEIFFIDIFLMWCYIFQSTHNFCSRFSLFFISFNLVVICVSVIEGFAFRKKSKKVNTFFTKQDGYRLLVLLAIYLIIFSFGNFYHFNKMYSAGCIILLPIVIMAIREFKNNEFIKSLKLLMIFEFLFISLIYLFEFES